MRPSEAVRLHRDRIRQIALSHRVRDVRVFGSAIRGEDADGRDLDLLVQPTEQTTLLDIAAIRQELRALLGMEVVVVTPDALPDRHRESILQEAQPL